MNLSFLMTTGKSDNDGIRKTRTPTVTKVFCFLVLLFQVSTYCFAQTESFQPYSVSSQSFNQVQLDVFAEFLPSLTRPNHNITLKLLGRINEGFHLYSVENQGEFAPDPTRIYVLFEKLSPIGTSNESPTEIVKDNAFEQILKVHKGDFWIEQIFEVAGNIEPGNHVIKGVIVYQLCNNRICSFPLEKTFEASLTIRR